MKKNLILLPVLALLLFSCTENNSKPDQEQMPEQDLSDSAVSVIFNEIKADVVSTDTLPKLSVLKQQGPNGVTVFTSEIPTKCSSLPKTIDDLDKYTSLKVYKFDRSMAASASAMGFSGEIGKKQMVFIKDFVRYSLVKCGDSTKKVGIGLRCFIHVTSFKGKLSYASLPAIAANVELQNAKASFELTSLGFGIDGDILADGFPANGDYSVENFGKLEVIFNNVLKKLKSGTKFKISPVELP